MTEHIAEPAETHEEEVVAAAVVEAKVATEKESLVEVV